ALTQRGVQASPHHGFGVLLGVHHGHDDASRAKIEGEADDIRAVGTDAHYWSRLFPAHRLYGALILLDLHRRVLAIEEDEIKAGVSQHRHGVFIQRPGCADNGLPRLQKISDRIHAKKSPTSMT